MKKLFAPILIFMLVMSGCQIFNSKTQNQGSIDNIPQDRRIGIVKSLGGVKTNNQGTHILTMDDGTTILLRSLTVNLDDPKYLAGKVEVSGVLTYTTDNKQIMEVSSIDVLDTTSTTETPVIPMWRDYINAAKGFQSKYRDDFVIDESGDTISFRRAVKLEALPTPTAGESQSAATPVKPILDHSITVTVGPHQEQPLSTLTQSRIGVDGIQANKQLLENGVKFSFDNGTNFYEISYSGGPDTQSLEDQNVFYEFLASFKLLAPGDGVSQQPVITNVPATPVAPTPVVQPAPVVMPPPVVAPAPVAPPTPAVPPTPVTGFETFTSAGYKFSIQYPKGWYFAQTTTTDTGITRRYNFGVKPVDQVPGEVNLDIGTGLSGGYTFTGKNGRVYRLTGPASMNSTLQAMIGTIQEQ